MAARQSQLKHQKVDLEELVDMFIEDRVEVLDHYTSYSRVLKIEGGQVNYAIKPVTKEDPENIFGDVVSDGVPINSGVVLKTLGSSLARAGDELWRSRNVSVSRDEVQVEVTKAAQLSSEDGEIPVEEEEVHWKRFKEMLDKALEDIGPNNPYRMMVAVLVTVKGMSNLGRGAAILARRFTLRFFDERRLRRDIERVGGIENLADENLD